MRPTREGKRFLLATALIAVAAYNTGNNLIYLILSMMLSILMLSVVMLILNLRGLGMRVSVEQSVFANTDSVIRFTMSNSKKVLPSYSIRVHLPASIKGSVYFPRIEQHSDASFCLIIT